MIEIEKELSERLDAIEEQMKDMRLMVINLIAISSANAMTMCEQFECYNLPFYDEKDKKKIKDTAEQFKKLHSSLVKMYMGIYTRGAEENAERQK